MANPEVEASLKILSLYTASSPIITGFCESADMEKAEIIDTEEALCVVAPATDPGRLVVVGLRNTEGWGSIDRLNMTFWYPAIEKSLRDDMDEIGSIETGYTMVGGGLGFTTEARLEEDFDPTEAHVRWVLGRISRVGELASLYLEENGEPPRYELDTDEFKAAIDELMQKMERISAEQQEELRRQGINIEFKFGFDISSEPPDSDI